MSELDTFLPRHPHDPEGLAPLTAADFRGAYEEPEKATVIEVARMLVRLMGMKKSYEKCGDKMREDLKNCARKLLKNARGDLDGVLGLEKQVKADPFLAKALAMGLSPYGLVPKLVTLYEKTGGADDDTLEYRRVFGGEGPLTNYEKHHAEMVRGLGFNLDGSER